MARLVLRHSAALLFAYAVLLGVGSVDDGDAYLAANSKKEGVIVTESGLQYKVVASAESGALGPASNGDAEIICHYEGKLITGEVFDSSYKRGSPATLRPKNVIKGWTEALKMMHVGDKWELVVPSELAYGSKGTGKKIPPDSVLVFDLELLDIKGQAAVVNDPNDWEEWLHSTHFEIAGFRVTYYITMPFFVAVLISIVRAVIMAQQQSYCVARHINTKTEEECYKALSRVNKGEDFAQVAKELSKCQSAKKGGSLGKFYRDMMAPEVDKVCFDVKKELGKVYGPIKSSFGWHVLIVDERVISESEQFNNFKKDPKKDN